MYRCLLVAAGRSYRIDRSCSIQSAHVLQAASLRRRSNLPTWSTVRHHCPQSSPRTDNLRLLQSPASGELANNGQAAGQLHHFSITRLQKKKTHVLKSERFKSVRSLQISLRRALPTMAKLRKLAPPYARSSPVKSLNDAAVAHHAVRSSSPAKERRQSIKLSS